MEILFSCAFAYGRGALGALEAAVREGEGADHYTRDLKKLEADIKVLKPWRRYTHHTQVVNDVQYHPISKNFIGSVSDDQTLQIVDIRQESTSAAALVAKRGHLDAINALAFNPNSEVLVATASADKTVGIWDLRNVKEKVHTLEGHNDAVTSLSWHPTEAGILGSGSYDRRIIFWDLSRVGEEQLPDDQEDGPPELYVILKDKETKTRTKANFEITGSSCTVVIPTTLPISAGIPTSHGWLLVLRKTTCCRSGRWPTRLSARTMVNCPSMSLTDR